MFVSKRKHSRDYGMFALQSTRQQFERNKTGLLTLRWKDLQARLLRGEKARRGVTGFKLQL